MFANVLLLLAPLVRAADPVSDPPPAELWDYPAPALWFADYRSAEQDFGLVQARWLRARILGQNNTVARDELKQAEVSYLAVRATLVAQRGLIEEDIPQLQSALDAARGQLRSGSRDPATRSTAMLEAERQIEELSARADQATRSALSFMLQAGAEAIAAREALERWWSLHQRTWRGADLRATDTVELARLDNAELELKVSVQGLDEAARSLVEGAVKAAEAERAGRRTNEEMLARLRDPEDTWQQQPLLDHIQDLEQALIARQTRLQDIDEAIDVIDRDLASLRLNVEPTPEERAFDELESRVQSLRATYDRLFLALPSLAAHVDADAWCNVHLHGAMLRTMLGEEGAQGMVQNAAATWQGTCEILMADQLEVPSFAASWAQALLRLHLVEPARVVFNLGPGVWTLDGTPVVGGGAAVFSVAPGLHRVEYAEGAAFHFSMERFDAGERLCVGLTASGAIMASPCAIGEAPITASMPSRAPYSAHIAPESEVLPELRPRTFLSLSGRWFRLPTSEGPLDLVGGSLELGWRLGRSPRGLAHLIFEQDLAYSPIELALTDSLSAPLLARAHLSFALIPDGQLWSPFALAGVGVIQTFHRGEPEDETEDFGPMLLPPPVLRAGAGLNVHISKRAALRTGLEAEMTFYGSAKGGPSVLPSLHIGMLRWI